MPRGQNNLGTTNIHPYLKQLKTIGFSSENYPIGKTVTPQAIILRVTLGYPHIGYPKNHQIADCGTLNSTTTR